MTLTLYHNPRCSKSRQALGLLQQRGLSPDVVLYLESPPDTAALKRIIKLLGVTAREMMRTKDELFKSLGLDSPKVTEAELIAAMVSHPILIERPILIAGQRAVIGRPPERVLKIL
jgi:arsenate reductase